MCGIIGFFNKDVNVNEMVAEQYEDQKLRGQEGYGMLYIDSKGIVHVKRSTGEVKFLIDLALNQSKMIVAHHRSPTSSDNDIKQTHPIVVESGSLKYKYYVVHNGIISNAKTLKTEHEKLGFVYTTEQVYTDDTTKFNDSESLAIELAMFIEEQTKEIKTMGSAAFIVVQVEKGNNKVNKVFFGRNSNPIQIDANGGHVYLASEMLKGNETAANTMYSFSPMEKTLSIKKQEIVFAPKSVSNIVHFANQTPIKDYNNEFATGNEYWRNQNKWGHQGRGWSDDYTDIPTIVS